MQFQIILIVQEWTVCIFGTNKSLSCFFKVSCHTVYDLNVNEKWWQIEKIEPLEFEVLARPPIIIKNKDFASNMTSQCNGKMYVQSQKCRILSNWSSIARKKFDILKENWAIWIACELMHDGSRDHVPDKFYPTKIWNLWKYINYYERSSRLTRN